MLALRDDSLPNCIETLRLAEMLVQIILERHFLFFEILTFTTLKSLLISPHLLTITHGLIDLVSWNFAGWYFLETSSFCFFKIPIFTTLKRITIFSTVYLITDNVYNTCEPENLQESSYIYNLEKHHFIFPSFEPFLAQFKTIRCSKMTFAWSMCHQAYI